MSQRLTAAFVAASLVLGLLALAFLNPLPYVTYSPGPTVDVLAAPEGEEIIQVEGAEAYRDDGELRMTTVSVTRRNARVNIIEVLAAWLDPDAAVYPYELQYPDEGSTEDDETQGAVQMVSSQDTAVAVALKELGKPVKQAVEVLHVQEGAPADGRLRVRDVFLRVDGKRVTSPDQVADAVAATPRGETVTFTVLRDDEREEVEVEPEVIDGGQRIGIQLGTGFVFPFDVTVDIDPAIGGPSAGLMFSLAVYDTLTPGSLTDGKVVAGTGEIAPDGTVGPIGGIQQKVAGARADGAELFLVPSQNCPEVADVDTGDMRLVRATTMHEAVEAIETWVDDPDAPLPSCETES